LEKKKCVVCGDNAPRSQTCGKKECGYALRTRRQAEREAPRVANAIPLRTVDAALAAYRDWTGWTGTITPPAPQTGTRRKIVCASDFHVPWHNPRALKALIEEESADTDTLVVAGDLADMWATSRFRKTKKMSDPCRDYREAQAVLVLLAERFREVIVSEGNHDNRPLKMLADLLPVEMIEYLRLTGPGALHPLELMAAALPNVTVVKPVEAGFGKFAWFHQIGDAVFSHAEKYSIIPNRAVSGPVLHWFKSYGEPQNLCAPFRVLIQGHTHQSGSVMGDYGVLCIENGCMCEPIQEYMADPKVYSQRPATNGWTVLYQDDGVTDMRSVQFKPLPPPRGDMPKVVEISRAA
jgi:predicted phosphodiesterase